MASVSRNAPIRGDYDLVYAQEVQHGSVRFEKCPDQRGLRRRKNLRRRFFADGFEKCPDQRGLRLHNLLKCSHVFLSFEKCPDQRGLRQVGFNRFYAFLNRFEKCPDQRGLRLCVLLDRFVLLNCFEKCPDQRGLRPSGPQDVQTEDVGFREMPRSEGITTKHYIRQ